MLICKEKTSIFVLFSILLNATIQKHLFPRKPKDTKFQISFYERVCMSLTRKKNLGAPYRIFLLFLTWLSCYFYLVVYHVPSLPQWKPCSVFNLATYISMVFKQLCEPIRNPHPLNSAFDWFPPMVVNNCIVSWGFDSPKKSINSE